MSPQASAAAVPAETPEGIPIPSPTPDPLSMREVLRVVTMRRLWYAQIVSVFGDFLALFAVISVMTFRLHATAQQVTGVQIAYMLPIALLGMISGVFVDRWPLKTTLVSSDFLRAGLCLLLLLVTNVWGFYGALAAISIVSSFFSPAQGAAIRSAVPLHGLRSANALMQQVFFIMRIIGPSAAAFIVAAFGARTCYWVDSLSFIGSGSLIASLALTRPPKSAVVQSVPAKSVVVVTSEKEQKTGLARVVADMREGAGFIFHHAGLSFVIIALAAGMFVMGCFGPLIAVYVRDTLHQSTRTFGLAAAMIGIGLMIGVNALNAFAKRIRNTTQVYFGLLGIGVGTAVMGLLPHTPSAFVGCFLVGFSTAGIIVPSQTLIQEETPQELMGRVGSTTMSAVFTAQVAGLILSGILAEHTSVRRVFVLCTAMLVTLAIAGKLWMEPKQKSIA